LDIVNATYNSAGGTVNGPHQFRNCQILETAPAASPTTLVLRQGGNRVVPDNLANTTLWVQGGESNGDPNLALTPHVTNHGTILLASHNWGYASNLNTNGFTFTNASDGLVEVDQQAGGYRSINGTFLNNGAVTLVGNTTLVNELAGGSTLTLQGGTIT